MSAMKPRYRSADLPVAFDAREKWENKISPPKDQVILIYVLKWSTKCKNETKRNLFCKEVFKYGCTVSYVVVRVSSVNIVLNPLKL